MTFNPAHTKSLETQINEIFDSPELQNRLQDVKKVLSHFAHHRTKEELERFIGPWSNLNARLVTPILNSACGCFRISEEDVQEFFNIIASQISR